MKRLITRTQCFPIIQGFCFAILAISFIITGCAGSGKPQYEVENYLLSYSAPSWDKFDKLNASIKFNRFSIDAAYNSSKMIFSNDPYSIDSFNYSRWAVNPADMIADNLVRDMRDSGLFRAVFSRYETEDGQFVISGSIEDFYLRKNGSNKTALVSISISLEDTRERETGKKMMFQKKYSQEEPLQESSPRGYCQAASQAMRVISEQITKDIYTDIKATVQSAKDNP
ncbi:MAG TPA: ABC-type transport auxiliary lipoprotein family protein [Smithella sp.]|nr:ABC-type transport auxiliary lipoprotein family protein [Smithella sp.]